MNFSTTKNTENVELFVINLANGNVLITDQSFNTVIKIPSMRNSSVSLYQILFPITKIWK